MTQPTFQSTSLTLDAYTCLYNDLDNTYQVEYVGQGPVVCRTASGEYVYSAVLPRARPSVVVGTKAFLKKAPLPPGPYLDFLAHNQPSIITRRLLDAGWKKEIIFTYYAELIPEGWIRKNVRKSARALVSGSIDEYRVVDNIDGLKALHLEANGKTRTAKTWKIQQRMIDRGQAFVIEGPDAAGLFYHNKTMAYYACGAHKKFARSHGMMGAALVEAGRIGCKWLELGNAFWSRGNNKMRNIAFFKEGFSSHTKARLLVYNEAHIDFNCVADARQIYRPKTQK